MPPHQTPYHLIEKSHELTLHPPTRRHDGDAVYALVGLAILLAMLLIAL